jgi:hypothetical protein
LTYSQQVLVECRRRRSSERLVQYHAGALPSSAFRPLALTSGFSYSA